MEEKVMKECKVLALCSQKGGVGKTTSCVNLAVGLAKAGKKVLVIDNDPQGSMTASLGYHNPDELPITLATILTKIVEDEPFENTLGILHHQEGIDLIPANIELSGMEVSLVNIMSRELVLKQYIERMREEYDYILIDCMPSLGMLTINALASVDAVIIPVQAAYLPVKGLEQLIRTIGKVRRQLNKQLKIGGILITMVDNRTNYATVNNNDVISICMFAVLENESDALSKEELGKYLSEKIPQYMIPVYCEYLSEIPLTVNGKIDIKVLTSRAIEGMKKSRSRGKSEQKLSETEENIYKVWCELFNTTDISVDEDFFECGGDSILVVKLLTELETRYQYKMSLMDVYSSPTIYKMAECITNQQ